MSYVINTSFKEQLSSVSFNRKIHTIVGENSVFDGFDVSIVNDEVIIGEGQCTIEGACIESRYLDEPKKLSLTRYKDFLHLWVCFQYNHVARTVKEVITVEDPTGAYCLPIAKLEKHVKDEEYKIILLNRVKTLASTNEAMNEAMAKIDEFDKTIDDFIKNQTQQHPSIAEVVEARGGEESLKARLDKADAKHKKDYNAAIEDINKVKKEVQDARFGADCLADKLTYMMEDCDRDKNEINSSIELINNEILAARGEGNETLADRLDNIESTHETDVENINNDISNINKEITDARGNSSTLLEELNSIKETIESNDNTSSSSINEIKKEIEDARGSLPTLSDKLNSMEVNHNSDIFAINTELKDARAGESKLATRLNKMQEQSSENTSRIEQLEDLTPVWQEYNGVGSVTVNDSFDGFTKDLVVKGRTLKNLVHNRFNKNLITKALKNENKLIPNIEQFENGKTYTVIYTIDEVPDGQTEQVNLNFGSGGMSPDIKLTNSTKVGIHIQRFTLTGLSSYKDKFVSMYYFSTIEGVRISDVMIFEGIVNEIPSTYFDSITSVGELEDNKIKIKSVGKNLISFEEVYSKSCTIDKINKTIVGTDSYNDVQFYVYLVKNCKYRFSGVGIFEASFDILKGKQVGYVADKLIQKVNNHSSQYFIYIGETGIQTIHIPNFRGESKDFQLEENTIATNYEQYREHVYKVNIPFENGLKGIFDISDTIEKNKIIQNYKTIIIDDSSDITGATQLTDFVRVGVRCNDADTKQRAKYSLCSKFPYKADFSSDDLHYYGDKHSTGYDVFYFFVPKSEYDRLSVSVGVAGTKIVLKDWKDNQSPLELIYKLKTPVIHKVKEEYIKTFNKITHIVSDNIISPEIEFKNSIDRDAIIEGNTLGLDSLNNKVNFIESETSKRIDEEVKKINNDLGDYLPLTGGTLTGALTLSPAGLRFPTTAGTWLSGKTSNNAILITGNSLSSYHPILRYNHNSGYVSSFGVLGNRIGIWGYTANRTENGTDAEAYLDVGTNTFHAAKFSGNGANVTGVNATRLNGLVETMTNTANTIVKRDGNGDINVRLLRSEYDNQTTISGAMAFRTNNSSDNYIRFCSDPAAIRTWLGAATSSHTHNYLPLTGGILTGDLILNQKELRVQGQSITLNKPVTTGGWARGLIFKTDDNTEKLGSFGMYGTGPDLINMYIGFGPDAHNGNTGLTITASDLKFKNNKVYHTGSKPTAADVGARPSSWVPSWGDITGKPSTFAPIIGTASNQAAAGNHNHDTVYLGKTATAASATKLATARTINGVSFDGTSNITITANPNSHTHDDRYYTESEINTKLNTKANTTGNYDGIRSGLIKIWDVRDTDVLPEALESGEAKLFFNNKSSIAGSESWVSGITFKGWSGEYQAWQIYAPASNTNSSNLYFRRGRGNTWSSPSKIYHEAFKPTAADVGARPSSWVPSWGDITGKPSTFAPIIGTASNQAAAGNHNHDTVYLGKTATAASATKLATARTINGVSFDGTSNITITANPNSHTHDDRYYTESEINTKLNTKLNIKSSVVDIDTETGSALMWHRPSNPVGYPTLNSNAVGILSVNTHEGNYYTQLALDSYNNKLLLRSRHNTSWTNWVQIYTSQHKPTAADVGARPNSWVPGWGDITGKPSTFAPIIGTASNQAAAGNHNHDTVYLGKTAKAADSSKLNGVAESTTSAINTIAKRDASGDINVRLLRSEYANQATISGAMAFRTNNSTDNYVRFCSDPAAIRTWLGAAPSSHTHNYLSSSGGALQGNLALGNGFSIYLPNNHGIVGKEYGGIDRYMLYMDASNRIHIGYNSINNVFIDAYTSIRGHRIDGWWISNSTNTSSDKSGPYVFGVTSDCLYFRTYNQNGSGEVNNVSSLGSSNARWKTAYLASQPNVSSDKRLKENIITNEENHDTLEIFYENLKPSSYRMKDGDTKRTHFGFIAQDVEEAMNIAGMEYKDCALLQKTAIDARGKEIQAYTIKEDSENPGEFIKVFNITDYDNDDRIVDYNYALCYGELTSLNTHFIQHSRKRITSLEEENKELKDKVSSLETRLKALEDMILNNA